MLSLLLYSVKDDDDGPYKGGGIMGFGGKKAGSGRRQQEIKLSKGDFVEKGMKDVARRTFDTVVVGFAPTFAADFTAAQHVAAIFDEKCAVGVVGFVLGVRVHRASLK